VHALCARAIDARQSTAGKGSSLRVRLLTRLFCREAFRALLRHKLRSGLTTIGIAIGVVAVVLVVAIGEAGKERAEEVLRNLGDSLVWVEAGSRNAAGVRTGAHGTTSLTIEDAEAIRREVPLIRRISPQIDGTILAIRGARNWTTRFRGETPEYLAIKKWDVLLGSPFTDQDVAQSASKVLIGQTVREQLFGPDNPVGEVFRASGQLFEVVGVLAAKGQSPEGRDQDDWILLPYTTAHTKLRGKGPLWLDDVLCSAISPSAVDPAIDQIISLLRERHHIEPDAEDDFNIRRPDEVLKAQVEASDTLAMLLLSVAAISLLVGGIGIMNVMLASVLQRTQEIGLRLAVGATELAVELQFLGEAVMLSLVGGVAGVLASALGASGFAHMLGWPISISPRAVLFALISSIGVGVCAGFYPARRAARLDPIAALRHE
jgi:putative ABC transport system permease protein